jgi:putative ABC transport system substrate-binding protein
MRRREFLGVLGGGVAAALPLEASAQQSQRMRRVGVLMNSGENDPEGQARLAAFLQGMQEAGWSVGRNLRIDARWGAGDADSYRNHAAELVRLPSDVIMTSGGTTTRAVQHATRTVPIVFVQATDPVGGGLVASLARPGGNATGFSQSEYAISAKWMELLKQIAPRVTRAAVLRDPANPAGIGQLAAIQSVAPASGVELFPVNVRDEVEIKDAVTTFAREANGGLIVVTGSLARRNRELIIALAAQHRLPAVYPLRSFIVEGGLLSYGSDPVDPYRRAAGYVDRILKGEKPSELAVQTPTKFAMVINLKTAKTLGLDVPPTLLARADEVIE